MPRVVIAGGAGFVGSHLCERYLSDGWAVVAVDNFITGSRDNVAHLLGEPGFELVEQDITEPFDVAGEVTAVLNFASPASPIDYQELPIETMRVGSLGTEHCLQLAHRKGATILQASTSEVYGDPEEHPQKETYRGSVSTLGPRACYDEAKRYGEAIVTTYRRSKGVDTRIIRIFNTYGPRMRINDGRVVPTFISMALRGEALPVFGDGSQTRSFCYVDDLVEGIVRVLAQSDPGPINLGNPTELTIKELAEQILELFGTEGAHIAHRPLPEDDPKVRKPDITLARKLLGWDPTITLADGLGRSVGYFRRAIADS